MSLRHLFTLGTVCVAATAACFVAGCAKTQGEERSALKVPENVGTALQAKFPGATIDRATHETEDGVEAYGVEFTHNGRHCEADIAAGGTILNWEESVLMKDLPVAASAAVMARYPNSTAKEVMRITDIEDGVESLEGYEIVLTTADQRSVEVMVGPTGEILEDSGHEK